ncbi:MAG: signal peptidase [Cryptosporangiaceae bacterium]|nr:signal peptidase [Cryptosporangiaceae bacterium]
MVRWVLIGVAGASAAVTLGGLVLGYQVVAVTSGSMHPAIEAGDALVVHRDHGRAAIGDVLVYTSPGSPRRIAHRVVEVRETGGDPYYRVKGDANRTPDATLVPTSAVYGRVVADLPHSGPGLYWFTQVGLKLALAVLFGVILVEELTFLIPALRARRRRNPRTSRTSREVR